VLGAGVLGMGVLRIGALGIGAPPEHRTPASRRSVVVPVLIAGTLLAVHFAAWTASLGRTTVANASAIVAAQPAVTLLAGHVLLGERLTRRTGGLVALAVVGVAVLGGADLAGATGGDHLAGNLLAGLGTVAGAGYLIAGRRARQVVPLLPWVIAVFGVCAVLLSAARLPGGLGLPWAALGWVVALTVCGQLAGHVGFNLLLARVPAWVVSVAGAGEAVGATVLAWWVLAEAPTLGFWLGAPLVIGAIVAAVPRS
jgi:drug/metabolite transporter (DMT)-like permease